MQTEYSCRKCGEIVTCRGFANWADRLCVYCYIHRANLARRTEDYAKRRDYKNVVAVHNRDDSNRDNTSGLEVSMKIEKVRQARDLLNEVLEEEPDNFPIPEEQLVWKHGNVWKPDAESDGNLVAVLRDDWPLPDKVQVLLRDGVTWADMRYTGSDHNGNRHHYRGNHPGGIHYAGKRKGGGCRVWYGSEFGHIALTGPPGGRYD